MKRAIFFLLFIVGGTGFVSATTHTITNVGFTFSPSSLTIAVGDTVVFSVDSIHQPREVDQATWDANGTTSNGGFDLPSGGGTVVITTPGIHYYVCVPHASGGMKGTITANTVTGITSGLSAVPDGFSLMQNYPNPFNPETLIRYTLPSESKVSVQVYDLNGKLVKAPFNSIEAAGTHEIKFDASGLATGIYFYTVRAGRFSQTKKMILLK